jgi:type IV secretion system protein VirD4
MRLILNQIGRRLTEELNPPAGGRRLLLMLDEFPALGRLDFFESALAFMAGYGIKAFLIAQSLNQIEKAYGQSNAILDNCHVRVSFATNDERTAKRISDALGTATERRAMKNYAGHRLSPWLGHLMVSRTETARALLTPGEVMQLPSDEEIVMASGLPPIRAKKARYFADARFMRRVLPAPIPEAASRQLPDDWSGQSGSAPPVEDGADADDELTADNANGGIRQEPELPLHEDVAPPPAPVPGEFDFGDQDEQADAARLRAAADRRLARGARAASLDPGDGIDL